MSSDQTATCPNATSNDSDAEPTSDLSQDLEVGVSIDTPAAKKSSSAPAKKKWTNDEVKRQESQANQAKLYWDRERRKKCIKNLCLCLMCLCACSLPFAVFLPLALGKYTPVDNPTMIGMWFLFSFFTVICILVSLFVFCMKFNFCFTLVH